MSRVPLAAVALASFGVASCGGGESEPPSAQWCRTTGQMIHLLDQHSTTLDAEALGDWEESSPEDVRAAASDLGGALRRYPVDAHASDLVAARKDVEAFAEDRCRDDWRVPRPSSG